MGKAGAVTKGHVHIATQIERGFSALPLLPHRLVRAASTPTSSWLACCTTCTTRYVGQHPAVMPARASACCVYHCWLLCTGTVLGVGLNMANACWIAFLVVMLACLAVHVTPRY